MKFLVVDSSAADRQVTISELKQIGYESIVEASSGEEALAKLDDSITLVILNSTLPDMSGIECTKAIRKSIARVVPIIITRNNMNEFAGYFSAGANGCVTKPVTRSKLDAQINTLVERFNLS